MLRNKLLSSLSVFQKLQESKAFLLFGGLEELDDGNIDVAKKAQGLDQRFVWTFCLLKVLGKSEVTRHVAILPKVMRFIME